MKNIVAIGSLILFAAQLTYATTGTVKTIIIESASTAELDEAILPAGTLVYRSDDPHDVRVGDGVTAGGLRIWNTEALTTPPKSFPHPINMNGYPIQLNGAYAMGADGPVWFLRANGSNVISVAATVEGVGTITDRNWAGDTYTITLAVPENAPAPLVQYSESITNAAWTNCIYTTTNTSPNTIVISIATPTTATSGYYRISSLAGHQMRITIPLYAPAITCESLLINATPVATGTPLYVESDPIWFAEKASYATGTPLYVFTETDPIYEAEKASYATGTPLYVYTETDPVYEAEKAGYATGTPLYVESDPAYEAEKSNYVETATVYNSLIKRAETEATTYNLINNTWYSNTYAGVTAWSNAAGIIAVGTAQPASNGILVNATSQYIRVADPSLGEFHSTHAELSATDGSELTPEISTNGTTWQPAEATTTPQHVRFVYASGMLAPGFDAGTLCSHITINTFRYAGQALKTNDYANLTMLVDTPKTARAAVNKEYVDKELSTISAADWATFEATAPVDLNAQPVSIDNDWTMFATAQYGWELTCKSQSVFRLTYNNTNSPNYAEIESIVVTETNLTATIAPAVCDPNFCYTTNLVAGIWVAITNFSTSTANNRTVLTCPIPVPDADNLAFRVSYTTTNPFGDQLLATIGGSLNVQNELRIYDSASTSTYASITPTQFHFGTNSFIVDAGGNITDVGDINMTGSTISNLWDGTYTGRAATVAFVLAESATFQNWLATNAYVKAETDPIWVAERSNYATGTPIYVETDPIFNDWRTTNAYIKTETDPIWVAERSNYATGTPLYAYSETDPYFSTWLSINTYVQSEVDTLQSVITRGSAVSNSIILTPASTNATAPSTSLEFIARATGVQCTNRLLLTAGNELSVVSADTTNTLYHNGNFSAGSYLTTTAGQTNYWRITTPPATNTSYGQWGQLAYDNQYIYIYNAPSSKWLRVEGTLEW